MSWAVPEVSLYPVFAARLLVEAAAQVLTIPPEPYTYMYVYMYICRRIPSSHPTFSVGVGHDHLRRASPLSWMWWVRDTRQGKGGVLLVSGKFPQRWMACWRVVGGWLESWGCLGAGSQRGNQQGAIVCGCEQGGRGRSPAWGTAGSQISWRCWASFGSC